MVLLEEINHWTQVLRVNSLNPLSVHSLSFIFVVEDMVSQLPASTTMPGPSSAMPSPT